MIDETSRFFLCKYLYCYVSLRIFMFSKQRLKFVTSWKGRTPRNWANNANYCENVSCHQYENIHFSRSCRSQGKHLVFLYLLRYHLHFYYYDVSISAEKAWFDSERSRVASRWFFDCWDVVRTFHIKVAWRNVRKLNTRYGVRPSINSEKLCSINMNIYWGCLRTGCRGENVDLTGWRKSQNEESHNLYSAPDIIRLIK
jgi:hypothetical protein